jgi:protein-S-isoprenylcysteine O-methyltransferase Ste14
MAERPRPDGRRRGGQGWFLAGYAGIAGFLALEALTREPGRAASLETSADDQGTTRMIVAAYAIAAELPLLLRRVPALGGPALQLPPAAAPAGLVLQAAGLGLRAWSMRTLGGSYTRTLQTGAEQAVITAGPYRLVRHPGYTGSLLTWTGFALTSRSLPVLALAGGLLGRAYQRRIAAEEQLLARDLPGYGAYQARTRKLVPYLW